MKIRVLIIKAQAIYAPDYEAWLIGWVGTPEEPWAMVYTDEGDTPWVVPLALVEMM